MVKQQNGFEYVDISSRSVGIVSYVGQEADVIIPEKMGGKCVARIEACAFMRLPIRTVYVPDGVNMIGDNAFYCCEELEEVSLPDSLVIIGNNAFCGCKKLMDAVLPEGVESIGECAYGWCESLELLQLPQTLKRVGCKAFCFCSNLDMAILPQSLEIMGQNVFEGCGRNVEGFFVGTPMDGPADGWDRDWNSQREDNIVWNHEDF